MALFCAGYIFCRCVKEVVFRGVADIEFDIVRHDILGCKVQQIVKIEVLFCFGFFLLFLFRCFGYRFCQGIEIEQFGLFFHRFFGCGHEKVELFDDLLLLLLGSPLYDLFGRCFYVFGNECLCLCIVLGLQSGEDLFEFCIRSQRSEFQHLKLDGLDIGNGDSNIDDL